LHNATRWNSALICVRRRRTLLQETAARRNVVEEVAHEELRPHGTHRRGLRHELPAVDLGHGPHLVALQRRAQLDLRHRGDRGQRLAPETERAERIDVVHRTDLARGMAVEGHPRVDGRHAAAVVHDLNQLLASVAVIDLHGAGPGVDGVLHHLLDHRRGPVHDLSGSDLIGDDLRVKV